MKFTKPLLLAATLGLAFSASAFANTKLVVAATPVPHAEILEFVKPYLKAHGVDLEIKVFTDYVTPNVVVSEGQADANFYLHIPYLNAYNKDHGTNIVPGFAVHIEPFGIYSDKYKSLDRIKDGALVALPNDPANTGRALLLLQQQGLIKLKDPSNIYSTERDVAENPHHFKFYLVEAANLPRILPDVDLDLINANYALKANLNPVKDALAVEKSGPYANIIATRPDNANSPAIKLLTEALDRKVVKDFILQKYQGAVIPVFDPKN